MTDPFLHISHLGKSYAGLDVLHDIEIAIGEGEFLVLVGPSGCGKSTLLNLIAGLDSVTTGEIFIRGKPVNGVHPSLRNIAMVFQSYALYPNMTVARNITFGLEMHGVPKEERAKSLAEAARLLQIEHLLDRKPGQLSGGQRQRVAMGRALVRNPDVFLFDEPLSNLDAKLRVDMRTEIKKLHQNLGITTVYVTHDQIEAMTLSTRIAVMNKGRVQQLGAPREIYESPANLFVAGFMGSPAMNLVPAVLAEEGGAVEVRDAEGAPVRLALPPEKGAFQGQGGRKVVLGLPPEALSDEEGADRKARHLVPLRNLVAVTELAGADMFVSSDLSGAACIARMRSDTSAESGAPFDFVVNMDKAVLFDPESEERISN